MSKGQHQIITLLIVLAVLVFVFSGVPARVITAMQTPDKFQWNLNPFGGGAGAAANGAAQAIQQKTGQDLGVPGATGLTPQQQQQFQKAAGAR